MTCENCTCDKPASLDDMYAMQVKENQTFLRQMALDKAIDVIDRIGPIEDDTKRGQRIIAMAKVFEVYLRGD